jgi:hypothetical protein
VIWCISRMHRHFEIVFPVDTFLTVCQVDRFLTVGQADRFLTVFQSDVPITTRIKVN